MDYFMSEEIFNSSGCIFIIFTGLLQIIYMWAEKYFPHIWHTSIQSAVTAWWLNYCMCQNGAKYCRTMHGKLQTIACNHYKVMEL